MIECMRTDRHHITISAFLRDRVDQGDVAAVVAAVTNPRETIYLNAFGKRDVAGGLEASADTIFRLASMTKPVTSLAVMLLVNDGKIQLDDPISSHLPEYRDPMVLAGRNS